MKSCAWLSVLAIAFAWSYSCALFTIFLGIRPGEEGCSIARFLEATISSLSVSVQSLKSVR
jgi:hypothetical protein